MKAKTILISAFVITVAMASGQRPTMELTFTAENNGLYVQLESIKVMNRTQGGDTVLYWPDTVLSIYFVGIPEINKTEKLFQVFQNYPNPVADQTTVSLFIPEKDQVNLIVTDILGRMLLNTDRVLEKGAHSFLFTPGSGSLFFFTAQWRGNSSSIKIQQAYSHSIGGISLDYIGSETSSPQLKAAADIQSFSFNLGDDLLYIVYADTLQSGMLDAPEASESYTFQFATNIPCPGMPTVDYEGQIYNTIQVFSQCWLKENLNVGWMIQGIGNMGDNGTIEKYCYNDKQDSCTKYGGLYQWNEMMQYTTQQGTQGICPPGWHLPSDEEWKVLEGSVDKQYGIGDPEWDLAPGDRGNDAGTNLKTISGWFDGGNGTDHFGFAGMPGGYQLWGGFNNADKAGWWWTSTESTNPEFSRERNLNYYSLKVYRYLGSLKELGHSVRCLRDN